MDTSDRRWIPSHWGSSLVQGTLPACLPVCLPANNTTCYPQDCDWRSKGSEPTVMDWLQYRAPERLQCLKMLGKWSLNRKETVGLKWPSCFFLKIIIMFFFSLVCRSSRNELKNKSVFIFHMSAWYSNIWGDIFCCSINCS